MQGHRSPGRLLSLALILFLLNNSNAAAVAINSPSSSLSSKQPGIPLLSARILESQMAFDGHRRYPPGKIMEGVVLPRDEPQPMPTGNLEDVTEEKNAKDSLAEATVPPPEITTASNTISPEHLAAMSAFARANSRELQNHVDWVHAGESARSAGLWTPDAGQPIPTQFYTGLSKEELREQNEADYQIMRARRPAESQCVKRDGEQCLPKITPAPSPLMGVNQDDLDWAARRFSRQQQHLLDRFHAGESARSAGLWTPDAGQPIPTQFFTGLTYEEMMKQNENDKSPHLTRKPVQSKCVKRDGEQCLPEITPAPSPLMGVNQDDLDWAARRFSRQQQHLLDRFHAGESARSAGLWTPDAGQPIPTQFFTGLTYEEMMKQNEDDKSPHLTRKPVPTKCVLKRSEATGATDAALEGCSEVLVGVEPEGLVKMASEAASEALVEGEESLSEEAPLPTQTVEEVYDPGYVDPMEYYADFEGFFRDMKSMKGEFTLPPNYKSDIGLPTPLIKGSTVISTNSEKGVGEPSVMQYKYHKYPPLPYFFDEHDRAVRNSEDACINPYTGEVLWDPKDHIHESLRPNYPDYPMSYALSPDAPVEPAKMSKREHYSRPQYDISADGLQVSSEYDSPMTLDTDGPLYHNPDQLFSIVEYYDDHGNPVRRKIGALGNPVIGEKLHESSGYPVKRPNDPDHLQYPTGSIGGIERPFMPPTCNGKAYDPRMYWCDHQWGNHDPCPVTFDHRMADQPSFVRWQPCGKGCYNPIDDSCAIEQPEPAVASAPEVDGTDESFQGVFVPKWSEQYAKDELAYPWGQDPGPQLEDLYDYEFFVNAQYFVPHDLGLPYIDAPMCGKKAYDPRLYYCANEMNVCPVLRQGVKYPENYAVMYKGCEEDHGAQKSSSRPQKADRGCCHGGQEK